MQVLRNIHSDNVRSEDVEQCLHQPFLRTRLLLCLILKHIGFGVDAGDVFAGVFTVAF